MNFRSQQPDTFARALPPAFWAVLLALSFAGGACAQVSSAGCGPIEQTALDYRPEKFKQGAGDTQRHSDFVQRVEQYHFKPETEALIRGTSGDIGGDLDFTLRYFPNHHRALISMVRLGEKLNNPQPRGARYPVECWLERAVRFAPDDTVSRLIYVSYLSKRGRMPEATAQLEKAEASAQDNPFSHYNVGLFYFELKNYDKALQQAHKAMAMGLLKQELADSLRRVGKWQDPPANAADAAASAASAADAASAASAPALK
jgi:tetratricopeptide (TPR) repeat protein